MTRERPPDRRQHQVVEVEHNGFRLTVGIGRFEDGRLGEVFLDTHKNGSALDTSVKDAAVLVSLLLQFGCEVSVIRRAISPVGAIAAVLTKIEGSK